MVAVYILYGGLKIKKFPRHEESSWIKPTTLNYFNPPPTKKKIHKILM